jgi:hypothetical protein
MYLALGPLLRGDRQPLWYKDRPYVLLKQREEALLSTLGYLDRVLARKEYGNETTFDFVSGVDFRYVLHHLSSLTRFKGSWGRVWPESSPKTKIWILVS